MANCGPDSATAEDPKERFGGCSISFIAPLPPGVLTVRKYGLTTTLSSWLLSHIAQEALALPVPCLSQHTAWREHHCSRNVPGEESTLTPCLSLCLSPLMTALLLCRLSHATLCVTGVRFYFNFPLNWCCSHTDTQQQEWCELKAQQQQRCPCPHSPDLQDSRCTSLHFSLLGVNSSLKSSYFGAENAADNMVTNCCCALPQQEAAASLHVLLLHCQVCLTALPKTVADAAEATGTLALHSLLVWLDY